MSKFVNTDVPLVIKCKHGHEFTNTANDMISKACPCCSDEFGTMDNEISIVENINRRGGILLSPYVSENVILCLQCEKTHTFKLSPINIRKGHWCGDCEKGK
ncbi:MAG: hypothetical protein JKY22_00360 [Flavobacteriaceae bacterium]|nr:hypothetical protein [Flavobacteriaceae bacterium]